MATTHPPPATAPVAFMSYAHHDDGDGRLTKFHGRLVHELRSQTGRDLAIFKDVDDIALGEQWRKRLDEGLANSTFLLPIITPSFLMSEHCREEFGTFLKHERALGRDDLILPIYYIGCQDFETSGADEPGSATLRAVLERQYFDWRKLRGKRPSNARVEEALVNLATEIRGAMRRRAPPPVPDPALTMHDAFISYASPDRPLADSVYTTLEAAGLACWMAPRDITPGTAWAEAFVDALGRSRQMVLLFSADANQSSQVMRETDRAVAQGVPILVFRVDDCEPTRAMEYFLSNQRLPALQPIDVALAELVEALRQFAPASGETAEHT
jgi:hypothetical protein